MKLRLFVLSVTVAAALSFSACGGGGMGSHTDPTTYTIAGTLSGLTATGLVLQNNAGDNLAVSANQTSFIFSTPISSGSAYNVTVSTQPSGETCTVTNGSGTADANVTNVAVSCTASGLPTYTIAGTITGLTAAGLVLQDNAADNLAISAGQTSFTFATAIPSGSSYNATVFTQPAGETCTITNGSGTADANVTNIAVSCSATVVPTYTIGGTITGLTGTGLVLQDNAADNLAISANQTSFTFATAIPSGSTYNVTVLTQPTNPIQTCTVTNGSGTANGNVTNVAVTCSSTLYTVSVAVSGLTGTLVVQDNPGNTMTETTNGTFAFSPQIPSGGSYAVSVVTQPSGETCAVGSNGSGTITGNVTVAVTCSSTLYTVSVAVSGLTGTLVVQDNPGNTITETTNGTFAFSPQIPSGGSYAVSVVTQPSGETCAVGSNGSGTITGNVTVAVTCSSTLYTVSVAVSGLTGTLVVQDNPGNTMTETTNGTFAFSPQIPSGGSYAVSVVTQPSGETCAVGSNGSGTITGNVTVAVTCSSTLYTVSVAVSGLTGTLVVQDNPGNTMTETTNGTFAFSPQIPSGGSYAVSVVTQPSGETCAVGSNASGTITGNVTVTVTCSATLYTVSVAISGLTGTVVVQDNPGNTMTETTNGTFPFSPQIPSGGSYAVSVVTQPSGETCTVGSNGSGTITGDVTVAVTCSATLYTVSVAISGLTGTVVVQDNPGNTMTETTNGTFAFSPQIPSGGSYAVSVVTQPSGETCTVGSNGSGTITGNVTVTVTCSATLYTVSVAISGLTGTVVVQDNPGNTMTETTNGTFPFSPQIPSGGTYAVSVVTQPSGETCAVGSNGSGTITGNVTVAVTCSASGSTFTIGGTVAGLTGSGLVLQDNGGDNLAISSGQTSFTFSAPIPSGGTYSVTVFTQPTGPTQTCTVTDGSGTANANVTNVLIACNNQWTWQNGTNVTGTAGNYGNPPTKKVFNSTNLPGARYGAVTWTDNSGNLWLFGGNGFGSSAAIESYLNDLWEWNGTQWAWMSGSDNTDQIGVYGAIGVTNGTNIPGARLGAVGWKDSSGNLWLFGGYGFDSVATDNPGPLNDLWEYSPTSKEWTYQGGSELINAIGIYGSKGSTNSTNFPGSRYYATASTDASGNFWLFGGEAFDKAGNQGYINDLWELNTTTLQWTYVSGANTVNQSPHYGTIGSGSALNVPGARQGLVSWIDSSQNFWLFGGLGIDSQGSYGDLNDLWEYSPSTSEWVWQGPSNSNIVNQAGNYVAIGQTGTPGGRTWPSGWLDTSGNFWLFGGQESGDGDGLNDLWLYSNGNWTWESGSSSPNQTGIYGTEGTASPLNAPGARWNAASWLDKNNNLWLFGGSGFANANPPGVLNDLWEFQP